MVMAFVSLRALASARVPSAKAGNSNTPMGPFQMVHAVLAEQKLGSGKLIKHWL
jgi:hypothetical protein